MSVHISSLVWRARLGKASRKTVALKLADCADDKGGSVFPSLMRIADEAEVGRTTAHLTLKEFTRAGLLEVVSQGGGGAGDTTRYRFNMRLLRGLAERELMVDDSTGEMQIVPVPEGGDQGGEPDDDKGSETELLKGSETEPLIEGRVQPLNGKGSATERLRVQPLNPNRHTPVNESITPPLPPVDGGQGEGEGDFVRSIVGTLPAGTEHAGPAIARIATTIAIQHANPAALYAEIADALKSYAETELDAIAREVIRSRKKVVAPKCVIDCVKPAIETLPTVTIREGDPRWSAWAAYHASRPAMINIGRLHGFTVRSNWPPGWKADTAGGAA